MPGLTIRKGLTLLLLKALTGDLDSTMTESMNNKQSAADARESLQSAQNEAAKHMEKLRNECFFTLTTHVKLLVKLNSSYFIYYILFLP